MKTNKTYEVCPHCGAEVELEAELKVQVCPNCGKHIVTCSMCPAEAADINCSVDCPLEILAEMLNEEFERERNEVEIADVKWQIARNREISVCDNEEILAKFYNTDITWKVGKFTEGTLYMNNQDGEMYLQLSNGAILYAYI